MSELDEAWALALAEAEQRARTAGRNELAEYIALRNSNDFLRKTGIDWLLNTFSALAGSANRAGASIQTSSDNMHRFQWGNATMVGRVLHLKFGVRRLTIEAGWPRVPRDGFIRGGGLAVANIKHMGMKSADYELQLIKSPKGPRWIAVTRHGDQLDLHEQDLRSHVSLLLGNER